MFYGDRMRRNMDAWRAKGAQAFRDGKSLADNPYRPGMAAQLWAEGYGDAFADAHPLAAIERLGGSV